MPNFEYCCQKWSCNASQSNCADLEQGDNLLLNPPNQPPDLPAEEENQQNQAEEPNQIPNLPPEQEQPNQLNQPPNQAEEPNQPNQPPNQPEEPNQPHQLPNQPNQPSQQNQPPNPPQSLPTQMAHLHQLIWSYFKPKSLGKPEEDAEAHFLRIDDWMDTHNFPANQKVRRFVNLYRRG